VRDYVLTLLVAAAVTYVLTPLVRQLAIRAGVVKEPRERDMHTGPVPRMGGLAMYIGLAAGLLVADQVPQLRAAFGPTGMMPGLLLAGGLLVVVGIIDDKWGMSALTKAAGQVSAGAILVATGTQLNYLPYPGGGTLDLTADESTLLTILIVVATINAVNFIDGLDGLAAGIVAIAAMSFLIYYYKMTQVLHVSELGAAALASAILTGVCLGFLPHNFHPARIFMGDTGAMLLGLVLAYAPIASITSLDATLTAGVNRYPEIMPLLLPAAILIIPYMDLLLAVVRRTRAGLSPFAADSKHLHHRLINIGHSQRASVLVMYLWAALFSGSIVWFSLERVPRPGAANHHGNPVLVFVVITAAALLALVLMSLPWLRKRDQSAKPQAAPAAAGAASVTRAPALAGAARSPDGAADAASRASPLLPAPVAVAGRAEPLPPAARSVVGSVPPALNGSHRGTEGNSSASGEKAHLPTETIPLPAVGGKED
jgi:UDP-GlcNAc:undecaprenyl-phosphate/decaprenyl-phosphate GlcNAc-1-phosphate transferase